MIIYLFMASVSLVGFWLYYYLVLGTKTFFKLNRWYLLLSLIFSLLAPLVYHFMPMVQPLHKGIEIVPYGEVAVESLRDIKKSLEVNPSNNNNFFWVITIYLVICGILSLRFLWGLLAVYRLKSRATASAGHEGITVYYCKGLMQPFSLLQSIYVPVAMQESIPEAVFRHEQAHIKQRHVFDIVFVEITAILLWFNPIVYTFKKALKLNLEYLADRAVIGQGVDIYSYQSLLLDSALQKQPLSGLAIQFISPLKNRIKMMKKQNSKKWQQLLIIGAIPLMAITMALNTQEEITKPLTHVLAPIMKKNTVPDRLPVDTDKLEHISAEFGMRMHPYFKKERMHTGIDFVTETGAPVYATADGVVEVAISDKDWGNDVLIKHDEHYETRYSHMQKFVVNANEKVKEGQIIGYVGSSGLSTGPHLHYEVHKDGEPVDPKPYLGEN